jgi:peptidoglycan/LPS O-acetylase OafA/YrhL
MNPTCIDHATYRSTRTFVNLDGVRALAVLAVVLYHFDPLQTPWLRAVQGLGFLGVDVFFVLSGFLITTLLLREPARPLGTLLRAFYMRRALRIFPLYYVGVAVYAVVAIARGAESWTTYRGFLPSLLLYWSDWRLAFQPLPFPQFGHAWSLAVEEKFYLLWPLAALLWNRRHGSRIALATIVAATVWRAIVVHGIDDPDLVEARLWYSFELRLDTLMWGCLLAHLLHDAGTYRRVAALAGHAATQCAAVAGALGVILLLLVRRQPDEWLQWRYATMPPLLAVLLAALVVQPSARRWSWLQQRPLAFVGRISYGVYVLHPLALSIVSLSLRNLPTAAEGPLLVPLRFGLYLLTTLAICTASHAWLERPLLRLKRRYRVEPN